MKLRCRPMGMARVSGVFYGYDNSTGKKTFCDRRGYIVRTLRIERGDFWAIDPPIPVVFRTEEGFMIEAFVVSLVRDRVLTPLLDPPELGIEAEVNELPVPALEN